MFAQQLQASYFFPSFLDSGLSFDVSSGVHGRGGDLALVTVPGRAWRTWRYNSYCLLLLVVGNRFYFSWSIFSVTSSYFVLSPFFLYYHHFLRSRATRKRFYPQRPTRQAMPWSQVSSLLPPVCKRCALSGGKYGKFNPTQKYLFMRTYAPLNPPRHPICCCIHTIPYQ